MKNIPHLFATPSSSEETVRVINVDDNYSGCSWHFHPEIQLCHVVSGEGQRLIGDRLCPIESGEVVLLGSNLPHVWRYCANDSCQIQATVIHFDSSLLGSDWLNRPELRDIRLLLARATQGLQTVGDLRAKMAEGIQGLLRKNGLPRIIGLLELLQCMAESRDVKTICSTGYQPVAAQLDVERLQRACTYINEHAHRELTRDAVANVVHMSGSGFSRFFKAQTGMTFQDFVSDVRISRACELLASTDYSITSIALECGFRELTTFNRAFKKFRDSTPSQYRSMFNKVAHGK